MTCQAREIHGRARREEHIEDVIRGPALRALDRATDNIEQIVPLPQQSFRDKKPRREFAIMTGRPHDDSDALTSDPNLQRFLDREQVFIQRTFLRAFDAGDRLGAQSLGDRHGVTKTFRAGAATLFAKVFI